MNLVIKEWGERGKVWGWLTTFCLFQVEVNDQLTSCIRSNNSLKGRACPALRPRRQDLPYIKTMVEHFSSAIVRFKQKNNSSSFISKELGFNTYSLKTSTGAKFLVRRPTRLMGASYVSQAFLPLEIIPWL